MGDAAALRQKLSHTNDAALTIQASASSMMCLYNTPTLAVTEWRNTLQTCNNNQLLPLLYVLNEVLQNSKRNRGSKFLEAFSPVLGDSLKFICSRLLNNGGGGGSGGALVEKVRRTVKIWGDRRVLSTRFVAGLLKGLDEYRNVNVPPAATGVIRNVGGGAEPGASAMRQGMVASAASSRISNSNINNNTTRQQPTRMSTTTTKTAATKPSSSPSSNHVTNDERSDDESDDNSIPSHSSFVNNDSDSDSVSSLFESTGPTLLSVTNFPKSTITTAKAAATKTSSKSPLNLKRRRSSGSTTQNPSRGGGGPLKRDSSFRKSMTLSSNNLMMVLNQLNGLDKTYDSIHSSLVQSQCIKTKKEGGGGGEENDDVETEAVKDDDEDIMEAVGDELLTLHDQIIQSTKLVTTKEKELYQVAKEKKALETEMMRYVNWAKLGLKADEEEIKFCDELEEKILLLDSIHGQAKRARDKQREEEAKERALAEAAAHKKAKEEKRKQDLQEALRTADESKPGMVWNNATREYQYLPDVTEESWRD